MSLHATFQNNVKVYTVASTSKSAIPEWLAKAKKKELRNDASWSKRVELIQDFSFPEASVKIKITKDGNYILSSGTYKPRIKCFDTHQASMKFERHSEVENVDFEMLSDDWTKFVMLQMDRTLEFHTQMGLHYRTRIPKSGRDLKYSSWNCDLLVAGASEEVYRLNLEQGQFMKPFETECPGVNVVDVNMANNILGFGGEDAVVEFWDPRQRTRIGRLDVGRELFVKYGEDAFAEYPEVTALKFLEDGLRYCVGTKTGKVFLYDLRGGHEVLVSKDHQYEHAIRKIEEHSASGNIISADSKSIKIWNKDDGKLFTSIEPETDLNDFTNACNSGLILTANEGKNMNIFFCPALGAAPKWCSFLDSLTEELEESADVNMWDDYRFLTRADLTKLGLSHLIGTKVLKAYMHGFFVDLRLYDKARAIANPFEYEEYRNRLIKEKIEKEQESRITATRKLPKVNKSTAEYLLNKAEKEKVKRKNKSAAEEEEEAENGNRENKQIDVTNPLGDDRFADMFKNPEFEVDEHSTEYLKFHTAPTATNTKKKISNESVKEESDDEVEGKGSDESSSSDEDSDGADELVSKSAKVRRQAIIEQKKKNKEAELERDLKVIELNDDNAGNGGATAIRGIRKNQKKRLTFGERLEKEAEEMSGRRPAKEFIKRGSHGAMAMTFKPSRGRAKHRSSNQKKPKRPTEGR